MEKKIKKVLRLNVFKGESVVFSTPIGAPEIVLGFLSSFNAPENQDMKLEITLCDLEFNDEKEND